MSDPGSEPPQPAGTAILLSVGTELSEGIILNTHFRFLGAALKGLGVPVVRSVQVPDEVSLFRAELSRALAETDLVIITGGLGPTSDDLTREVAAEAAGVALEFREELWSELLARYGSGGPGSRPIARANRRQAYIPATFEVLPNRRGTAPGFWGRAGDCLVAALPGPPGELEPMFLEEVVPRLRTAGVGSDGQSDELVATVLLTPESVLEQSLQELLPGNREGGEVRWGTRVTEDRIVLTLRGGSETARQDLLARLKGRIGDLFVRPGEQRPVERFFQRLDSLGQRAAFAESCTGGLLSKLMTDLPGSSRVFWGAVVAYDNAAKTRFLGVAGPLLEAYGAVSAQSAEAMSAGLLSAAPVDLALAVTGVAGPDGGTPEKPVGTVWISARTASGAGSCLGFRFRGGRDLVRRRSAVAAFLLGECLLAGADPTPLLSLPA